MLTDVDQADGHPEHLVGSQRWIGLFWVILWAVWPLEPLVHAWDRQDIRGWIGLVAVLLFTVGYIFHFLRYGPRPFHEGTHRARSVTEARIGYLLLAVLTAASVTALGQPATVTMVFLAILGVWVWGLRVAVVLATLIAGGLAWMMWNLDGWEHQGSTLLGLVFGVIAVAVGMLAGRRRRELEEARIDNARLLVTEERGRLSRDLHDIVGHSLTVMAIKAELAERLATSDPDRARHEMVEVQRLSRAALTDVQQAVEGYRELSLSGEIVHAREVLQVAGIAAELPTATDDVPEDVRDLFAWTIREAVTNVVRHSRARVCRVVLSADQVVIQDDGVGADDLTTGRGLGGLRERAMAEGAVLSTASVAPHGLRLQVSLPVKELT